MGLVVFQVIANRGLGCNVVDLVASWGLLRVYTGEVGTTVLLREWHGDVWFFYFPYTMNFQVIGTSIGNGAFFFANKGGVCLPNAFVYSIRCYAYLVFVRQLCARIRAIDGANCFDVITNA